MKDCRDTFFFIPHTHWEGAVFKTREEYLEMGLPNILRALRLLKQYPAYRFTLDQVCYVKPFLERYPEEEAAFRRFVAEGRLAIVGGTDVMPDVNMPGGESFVRQVLYGKRYFRKKLGVDVTVGWQLDTFGHHAQMPQLLKLAGYKSFWFFRGVSGLSGPSEFLWEGLDGSRIPAFWLPHGYANVYGSPNSLPEFTAFIKEKFDALTPFAQGPARVGLSGADVCEPEEHVPQMVAEFNQRKDTPFHLQLGVPSDFEAVVAQRSERSVIRGELNPIFQGTYSSRIELKQRTRELERLLTTAEKMGVLLRWLEITTNDDILRRAWEPMLFNQAHDLMSGVMTDRVYEDTIRGYDFSRRIAGDELQARLEAVGNRIDTQGDGIPLVVFNTLSWLRTDIAVATVGFTDPGVQDVKLVGPDGGEVPCQILDAQHYADGSLLNARVAFVARDVPALGHAVHHIRSLQESATAPAAPQQTPVLENEFYRLKLDPVTGAISKLTVNDGNWDALSGPGNIVAMETDKGDFWEFYRPLDGGSRIAMTERHAPPRTGTATFSNGQAEAPGAVTAGPVMSEFIVAHPFSAKGRFRTTVRIYAGVHRIEIQTKILNHDTDVRYRVLFPTTIQNGNAIHEIPFGAIERPDGIEFPAQNWIDWGDGKKGVALLNRGLPGNNVADGVMMLSLMRSTRIKAYGFGGGHEPGMGSDSGLELGKELTFDYALVPHSQDWRQAAVYHDGLEFNNPLITLTANFHPGVLPNRWGFLDITCPNVVVSALKPGEDGSAVLRIYETTGQPVDGAKIKLSAHIASAEEVDLMENPVRKLNPSHDTVQLNLQPFEIKTIRLRFKPGKKV
ncbi:MAG: glycoside hydrolase family 38 C-terminal domain-containing protein [Candidatus Omnitrophota bacterium]